MLLSHNSNSIPIYKYISQCNCTIPEKVNKEIKDNFEGLLSRTIIGKKTKMPELKEMSIQDVVNEYGEEKALEYIAMLPKEKIDIYELGELLKKYYNDNPHIFKSGKQNLKTNFRRLIKIYDWLKYYK